MRFPAVAVRRCPATSAILLAAVALFIAVEVFRANHPNSPTGARDVFGAVSSLQTTGYRYWPHVGRSPFAKEPVKITGLLNFWGDETWNGEWWRILASGFHHAGLLHLLPNLLGIAFLGWLIERRIGSCRYLLFFLTATTVSFIPSFLMGHTVIGLSGGACGALGLLIVLRQDDDELADLIPFRVVVAMIVVLFIGFLTNEITPWKQSNLSHFSGLIYGWVAGFACYGSSGYRRLWTRTFVVGHLLLVPAMYYVTHPFWNAEYHRALAMQSEDSEERARELNETLRWNPNFAAAWGDLAALHAQQGDFQSAWRAASRVVYYQRHNERAQRVLERIWRQFRNEDDRQQAMATFRDVFGDEANDWQKHLAFDRPRIRVFANRKSSEPDIGLGRFSPWIPGQPARGGVDLYWPPVDGRMTLEGRRWVVPRVRPDDPHSALLGRSM